ncbi:MAG: tRNA epoxyqueuosine(34) reductase QueG [Thermoflexales bacterium]
MLRAALVREKALELGFDLVGFAPIGPAPGAERFLAWLAAGYHGEMAWLTRTADQRADPRLVLGKARTVVMVGLSYESLKVPMELLRDPSRGRIARYAWGADYHDVITPVLRAFGEWMARESRAWVDTGPVLERAWAERCGLGFIGKNTCLIHPRKGSYLFLGAVLVAEEIEADETPPPVPPGCGRCTRCLRACPTGALPVPGVLDARRCISYLTIELKGSIPTELRPHMGNWVFGCDDCQDVCPYVRQFSRPSDSPLARAFQPFSADRAAPPLVELLQLDEPTFRARYRGTPLTRVKRRGLVRNACVAAGNWGSETVVPHLQRLLEDTEPLIREHAAWALARILRRDAEPAGCR